MLHIGSASAFQAEGVSSILIIRSRLPSSVVEHPPCKRKVVSSILTGGSEKWQSGLLQRFAKSSYESTVGSNPTFSATVYKPQGGAVDCKSAVNDMLGSIPRYTTINV